MAKIIYFRLFLHPSISKLQYYQVGFFQIYGLYKREIRRGLIRPGNIELSGYITTRYHHFRTSGQDSMTMHL